MSHLWRSHITHMMESCHTYDVVVSHIWRRRVLSRNESRRTYERIMSHIGISLQHVWRSHVIYKNKSCDTHGWVMSHIWLSHAACMREACHRYREKSDLKYLDLEIYRVFPIDSFSNGDSDYTRGKWYANWEFPWKCDWYTRELPWKRVGCFRSRIYFKSDLLRSWHVTHMNESCHT